jgi:hypothetical protein
VDIQDEAGGLVMRMKAFGAQAKQIADLKFLTTHEFHGFECKPGLKGDPECGWRHRAAIQPAEENLDNEDAWDGKEYGPLSDIRPGQTTTTNLSFIVKLVSEGPSSDSMINVNFLDEEGTTKRFSVHETFRDQLLPDRVYVIHRARIVDNQGWVEGYAMLTAAPKSYMW